MSPEIIYSLIAALTSSAITFILLREKFNRDVLIIKKAMSAQIMEIEKTMHDKQIEYTIEKNKMLDQKIIQEKNIANASFSDGYEKGKLEQKRDSEIQIREKALSFQKDLIAETENIKNQLEAEFLKKQQEIEQQICVVVRPYVEIETEKGIIYNSHQSSSGYQYQLMVSGIPVFQPHVIIESRETIKEVNEERVDKLLSLAEDLAKEAIHSQLPGGKAKSLLTIGKGIILRKTKQ